MEGILFLEDKNKTLDGMKKMDDHDLFLLLCWCKE